VSPKGAVAPQSVQKPKPGAAPQLFARSRGDLWPLEQKLSQHCFCLCPTRYRHASCGIQAQQIPPRWPRRSHGLEHAGQSADFASWMKEQGLVPSSTDGRRVPCHLSVGLQGEPRQCCPCRKPPPRCGDPRVGSRGCCCCVPGLGQTACGDVTESSAQIFVQPLSWVPLCTVLGAGRGEGSLEPLYLPPGLLQSAAI